MTTARTTPAPRRFRSIRRAGTALALAFGVTLTALPAQQASAAGTSVAAAERVIAAPNYAARVAVWAALSQRGKPYAWGGDGPSSFDCSGLTQFAMDRVGVNLPHSSRSQSRMGTPISRSQLRPGDLVFFYSPVGHVGMYIGKGRIVHAPTRGSVVHITKLSYMSGYAGARRFL